MKAFFVVFLLGIFCPRAFSQALDCKPVIDSVASVCKAADSAAATAVSRDCSGLGGEISALETRYQAEVVKCAGIGGRLNAQGQRRVRGGQAPIAGGTGQLLEQNRALLSNCAKAMGEIEAGFRQVSAKVEEAHKGLSPSSACKPKVDEFYKGLKDRADQGALKSKAKAGEYGGAEQAMEMKRDVTNNNASGLSGDQKKAENKSDKASGGGGGGMPDPSSLMKAMADQKAKQDAEEAKRKAEEKARLEREKDMRIQQCKNNEILRKNALKKCKDDFPVDPRYTIVVSVKKDQEDCIANVGATYGAVVLDCAATP